MEAGDTAFELLRSFVERFYGSFRPGTREWKLIHETGEKSGDWSSTSVLGDESGGYEMTVSRTFHGEKGQEGTVEEFVSCKAKGLPDDMRVEITVIDAHGGEPPHFTLTVDGQERSLRAFLDRGRTE
jgi:hypothetical protein